MQAREWGSQIGQFPISLVPGEPSLYRWEQIWGRGLGVTAPGGGRRSVVHRLRQLGSHTKYH